MNEKLSITLPSELVAIIREQVDSGRYESVSDVVREALERQDWEQELTEADVEYMREKTRRSLANPKPAHSVQETREHMDAFIKRIYQQS